MQRVSQFLIILTISLLVLAPAAASADFQWSGQIAPGKTVRVEGVNGNIRASSAVGGQVEVTAVKSGRDAEKVKIEAKEHDGGVTIEAIYPKSLTGNTQAAVSFEVRVPAGVRFAGQTVNGDIETAALDSEVDARTVNGAVRVANSRRLQAKTVNGSIMATIDNKLDHPLELETVNGRITVEVPASANADLQATTVNGNIKTDLPVTVKGVWGKRSMSGRLGVGGPILAMRTVNGKIEVRQAGQ